MNLINDWKHKFPRLWSVRLALLAALLSGAEVAMNLWASGRTLTIALLACLVSIGAAIARIVAQPKVSK